LKCHLLDTKESWKIHIWHYYHRDYYTGKYQEYSNILYLKMTILMKAFMIIVRNIMLLFLVFMIMFMLDLIVISKFINEPIIDKYDYDTGLDIV